LHQGDVSPEIIVEDWNTWFYSENNEQLVSKSVLFDILYYILCIIYI